MGQHPPSCSCSSVGLDGEAAEDVANTLGWKQFSTKRLWGRGGKDFQAENFMCWRPVSSNLSDSVWWRGKQKAKRKTIIIRFSTTTPCPWPVCWNCEHSAHYQLNWTSQGSQRCFWGLGPRPGRGFLQESGGLGARARSRRAGDPSGLQASSWGSWTDTAALIRAVCRSHLRGWIHSIGVDTRTRVQADSSPRFLEGLPLRWFLHRLMESVIWVILSTPHFSGCPQKTGLAVVHCESGCQLAFKAPSSKG